MNFLRVLLSGLNPIYTLYILHVLLCVECCTSNSYFYSDNSQLHFAYYIEQAAIAIGQTNADLQWLSM